MYFAASKMVTDILIIFFFFFNDTATTEIYTLSLHDALPISDRLAQERLMAGEHLRHRLLILLPELRAAFDVGEEESDRSSRSEEQTCEIQSPQYFVCRLLLEKKNISRISSAGATIHPTSSIS